MKTLLKILAVVTLLAGSLATTEAMATGPKAAWNPGPIQWHNAAPRLGFWGHWLPGQGVLVKRVYPGSFAAKYGIEPGDMIVEVNGRRVTSQAGYYKALIQSRFTRVANVLVKNVRYYPGSSVPPYVHLVMKLSHQPSGPVILPMPR